MELRNLEIFCDVVSRRSFSKAAAARDVTQSAASQAVKTLETYLGIELLDRSTRPFHLTPAGEVYFDGCRDVLERLRRVEDRVRKCDGQVSGHVRVAAIFSTGLLQMNHYVRQLRERFPQVEIAIDYCQPDAVYSRLRRDEADVGLVSYPRGNGDLEVIPWQNQPMVLVMAPDHRLAQAEQVRLSDIQGEPFVHFTSDLRIRREIERGLRRAGIDVETVYEFDSVEHVKRAIEIRSGISILPLVTVEREVQFGTLSVSEMADAQWFRPLGVVHKRDRALTSAAAEFVNLLMRDKDAAPPEGGG